MNTVTCPGPPLAVRTSVSFEDPDAWVGESEPVVLSQMMQEENE
jgi:hypothetical protein